MLSTPYGRNVPGHLISSQLLLYRSWPWKMNINEKPPIIPVFVVCEMGTNIVPYFCNLM